MMTKDEMKMPTILEVLLGMVGPLTCVAPLFIAIWKSA